MFLTVRKITENEQNIDNALNLCANGEHNIDLS